MQKITDVSVKAAAPKATGYYLWDSVLSGFGLRVNPGGSKTFVVLVTSGVRKKIGRYPTVSLAEARAEAKRLLAEKALGRVHLTRTAWDDAVKAFLDDCAERNRPKTCLNYRQLLTAYFKYKRKPLGKVTAQHVLKSLEKLSGAPAQRHHAYVAVRAFFNWCTKRGYLERSPIVNTVAPPQPEPRQMVIEDGQLAKIYDTALTGAVETAGPFDCVVALLCLTGQRRGEIVRLEWDWVKKDIIHFPGAVTKNRRDHALPLTPSVAQILEAIPRIDKEPYVFPAQRQARKTTTVFNGWSKAKREFNQRCGFEDWHLHAIRRTFSTKLAELGIQQVVTEKILNHISGGAQSPISRVYNKYEYRSEVKEALLKWERYLDSLEVPMG